MGPTPLALLLVLPLVGTLVLTLLPAGFSSARIRSVAALPAALQVLLALICWQHPPADLQLSWLPTLGLSLDLGLDGLSLPLVLLCGLLTSLAILSAPADQNRPRLFFSLMLLTNLGVMGAFLARNALLFLLAFELVLIPLTLLIATWGGERRAGAAIRYLLYSAVSGLCMLAAVLAFAWFNAAGPGFDFADLASAELTPEAQRWILALLLLAFGLKLPVVPLHGWQPFTYGQASTPVVILLAGVVSKLGAYGLLRFGVGFLPEAWTAWSPWIAAAGAISAVYGALNAIAQTDIRRLMAFSSLGHMGLLVLALAAATPLSLQGAIAQMLAHGLIVALLFACVGLIERKTGTTSIPELSGLMNPLRGLPFTMGMLLLALMAAAGIPGLAGFPAELVVFEGSWTAFPVATLISLIASGFTAVYAIRLFNRVGFGRLDNTHADWAHTLWSERAPAMVLTVLVIAAGLWPTALTGWSEAETAGLAVRAQPFLLGASGPTIARSSTTLVAVTLPSAPELLPS
ncbi:NADH-quinone oxidoreductase subunit M [Vulcanococcus limneticus Candia 3F8]|uniref:NADH-quinone oxidoreductase subunit M n=1 Tax=Vulcanococcus limneticus TaxID=2170428 RepID=UPI000B98505B|nr:NADH-quinone oxidoreductase subunit M [Vulcanococcus limneticus]MCP9790522.1 NADH-quinone oxidoreductase subunit M [Vulcanococcus limneticus MW73D5]MCP9892601.1 NADH-quinone oxidoreductase subunit M [Vulcanococcus limneticus Candia 3F8]MCP9896129.1 NADH-quinone oxidoreductase subunit M [Vulcanococcus limneticus Candia 3B3]